MRRLTIVLFSLFLLASTTLLVSSTGNDQYRIVPKKIAGHHVSKKTGLMRQNKDRPPEDLSFSDEMPQGKWSVSAVPDDRQVEDATTPVVVNGLSQMTGSGKWAGALKVISVRLTNRSTRAVRAVRLGWIVTTAEARKAMKPDKEAKLIGGSSPLLEVELAGGISKRTSIPPINFIKEAKKLFKKGVLEGDFFIKVRVVEVFFEDGSSWKEAEGGVAFLKASYRPLSFQSLSNCVHGRCVSTRGDGRLNSCENDVIQGNWSCWENPNSCGDGFCICNVDPCSGCRDDDNDGVGTCRGDCNDNDPAIGVDCSPTPTPTPTPTPSPTPCVDQDRDGACVDAPVNADCDDNNPSVRPGLVENCYNGVNDDCANGADGQDPACQDSDGDGEPDSQDCAPDDSSRSHFLPEICSDGVDNDCDIYTDSLDPDCRASGGGGDLYYTRTCSDYYYVMDWYWCPAGQDHVDSNCTYSHTTYEYAGCWY